MHLCHADTPSCTRKAQDTAHREHGPGSVDGGTGTDSTFAGRNGFYKKLHAAQTITLHPRENAPLDKNLVGPDEKIYQSLFSHVGQFSDSVRRLRFLSVTSTEQHTHFMIPGTPIAPDAYEKLSDNAYIVYKCYFSMSRRLAMMNVFSQWTLSLLSIGLIIIPLLMVTKMHVRYEQNIVDFASITLAVAVLVFSLLIAGNNYTVRADRAHTAGLELNDIVRDMRFHSKDADRMSHYTKFEQRYSDILKRYENTEQIDYLQAKISINKDKTPLIFIKSCYCVRFCQEIFLCSLALVLEFGFIARLTFAI